MSSGLSAGVLIAWGLAAVRIFAILRVQPHFRAAVGPWWTAVAAALGVLLAPVSVGVGTVVGFDGLAQLAGFVLSELLLGTVIGLFVGLFGYALLGALSGSAVALGLPSTQSRTFVGLGLCLVLAGALGLGLHRPLVAALQATMVEWPVARADAWVGSQTDLLIRVVGAAHAMTVLALSLATPVLLSLAVVDLGTRLAGRGPGPARPTMDALRPWLRTAAALVALGASWSAYPEAWARTLG